MKYLLPIINLILAGGLFFVFTDQMMVNAPLNEKVINSATKKVDSTLSTGGIRSLLVRQDQLNEAIVAAKAVSARAGELAGIYNSFSAADLARLNELLPDHVDNIQLIIDVNGIAKKHSMSIKNVKVSTGDESRPGIKEVVSTIDPKLGAMILSFSVTGSYDSYKKFIADLASSLRIIDMSSISFATDDKGIYAYNVSLKTYWLK